MRIRLHPMFLEMLPEGRPYAAAAMAFDAWRGYPAVPDLVIEAGEVASIGHHRGRTTNGVYWVSDWPYEDAKLAVTVVTYEQDSGRLLDADILINGAVAYDVLDEQGAVRADAFDLAAVLTHEAGHVLGLGESDDAPEATMFPYAQPGDTHQRTLADDDEQGVIEAYSAPVPAATGCGQASVLGAPHGPRVLWPLALLPVLGCVLVSRRRRVFGLGILCVAAMTAQTLEQGGASMSARADDLEGTDRSQDVGPALPDAPPPAAPELGIRRRGLSVADQRSPTPSAPRVLARASNLSGSQEDLRLAQLLERYPQVHVGRARRGAVDQSGSLWFTPYVLMDAEGREVEIRLPGGSDGTLVQQVGDMALPEDGSELLVARDGRGRAVWTYHRDGQAYGGALSHAAF